MNTMITCDALYMLTKDTEHLPESSFYLWCADILVKEATKNINKKTTRDSRYRFLQEIEQSLAYALNLFDEDKQHYTDIQKQWFLEKKVCVDCQIKALQVKCVKLLITELKVV